MLGGISTSILFSAFESWLISSAGTLALTQSQLSAIFGRATLVNGFVAFSAGIASDKLVESFDTFTSPFIASGLVLIVSWVVIKSLWTENFGSSGGATAFSDPFQLKRLGQAWSIVRRGKVTIFYGVTFIESFTIDTTLLTLGLTQTCFEGSMYLFVFAWVPSLQEASSPSESLPLGYIFSAFMLSMMLGSLCYTTIATHMPSQTDVHNLKASEANDNCLTFHAKLSSLVCAVSALSLAVSVSTLDVRHRFWAFCMFEACVGMYYPIQGMLRGTLVSNDHRATVSVLNRNNWSQASLLMVPTSYRHSSVCP